MSRATVYNLERELFTEAGQAEAFEDYVYETFGTPGQHFDEATGNYYRRKIAEGWIDPPEDDQPFLLRDRRKRAIEILDHGRRQRAAGEWVGGRLHDGRGLDDRPKWVDPRPADYFDEDRPRHTQDHATATRLLPFLERRTDAQQIVLRLLYGPARLSFRDASTTMGLGASGAQSHQRQAVKMLRKELLKAYAPDADPDEQPRCLVCRTGRQVPAAKEGWGFGGLRPRRPRDLREKGPSGLVRVKIDEKYKVPGFKPRPRTPEELAEWRWRIHEDETEMVSWGHRGYTNGPPDERRTLSAAGFVNVGAAVRQDPIDELPKMPWFPRSDGRGWRAPTFTEPDQSPEHVSIADVMRRAPGETDRGAGVHPTTDSSRRVWAGLRGP